MTKFLSQLGIYGWDEIEPVLLSAISFKETLLLTGKAGTAKSVLFDRLARRGQLKYRKYNASLLNVEDLLGIPMPNRFRTRLRYIKSPETIWGAEAVFIDEINRCKPELQNKLFPLIYDRTIQGVELKTLKYRWAAMNDIDDDADPAYVGAEPLDKALLDRFVYSIEVPAWNKLSLEEKGYAIKETLNSYGYPPDKMWFANLIGSTWIGSIDKREQIEATAREYAATFADMLFESGIEISTRRVGYLAKTFIEIFMAFRALRLPLDDYRPIVRLQALYCLPGLAKQEKEKERLIAIATKALDYTRRHVAEHERELLSLPIPEDKILFVLKNSQAIDTFETVSVITKNIGLLDRYKRRTLIYFAYLTLKDRRSMPPSFFETIEPEIRDCFDGEVRLKEGGQSPIGYWECQDVLSKVDVKKPFGNVLRRILNSFILDHHGYDDKLDVTYVANLFKKYWEILHDNIKVEIKEYKPLWQASIEAMKGRWE